VAVALSPDGRRAAAATLEGTIYAWDLKTGAEIFAEASDDATGPPSGSLRFVPNGRLLVPTGDRRGMRLIDLSRRASQIVVSGDRAYHAVSIGAGAEVFAVLTSTLREDRGLIYGVEMWKIPRRLALNRTADRSAIPGARSE